MTPVTAYTHSISSSSISKACTRKLAHAETGAAQVLSDENKKKDYDARGHRDFEDLSDNEKAR